MSDLSHLGAPKVEALFANGRSPACWQRQVSRMTSRLATLAHACAWVDEVVRQPAPTLRPGLLLGDCLAELVEFPPPVGQAKESEPPRMTRSSAQSTHVGRRAAMERAFVPPRQAASGKAPSLPKSATAPSRMLHNWAGKTAISRPSPTATPRRARPPIQSSKRVAPPPEAAQASQQWASRTVKRAWQQFTQQQKDTPLSWPAGNTVTGHKGGLLQDVTAPEAPPAALEVQWQQPLAGQRAPGPLLQKLRVGAAKAAASVRDAKPANAAPARLGTEAETAAPTNLFARNKTGDSLPPFAKARSQKRPTTPNDHTDHAAAAGEVAVSPQREIATEEAPFELLPRFAPPQLAEMLPRLRPLLRPGTTDIFPIAASTAENSGRREGTPPTLKTTAFKAAPPDDLDALARQIKQILDEEARRHGIGV